MIVRNDRPRFVCGHRRAGAGGEKASRVARSYLGKFRENEELADTFRLVADALAFELLYRAAEITLVPVREDQRAALVTTGYIPVSVEMELGFFQAAVVHYCFNARSLLVRALGASLLARRTCHRPTPAELAPLAQGAVHTSPPR